MSHYLPVGGHLHPERDARVWRRVDDGSPIPTLFDRCAALHARMDAVLAETKGVGRVSG